MHKYRRFLPTREQLADTRSLKFIEHLIFEPNLWHFNRHSVSFAFLVGIFCCFLPMPFQMVPCALLCFWIRCNIPLAIALVWVSNPLTMPPMFYFTYRLGLWMLRRPDSLVNVEFTMDWITAQLELIWAPLVLGSVTTGLTLGIIGFVSVRVYWRWKVTRQWNKRRARQKLAR